MARRKKAVTGLVNELAAQLNLAKDPNILVFTPLGGLGPVDIVTLNMTTGEYNACLLYTSPSPRDGLLSRMPSSA